jgi:hypothetical protein
MAHPTTFRDSTETESKVRRYCSLGRIFNGRNCVLEHVCGIIMISNPLISIPLCCNRNTYVDRSQKHVERLQMPFHVGLMYTKRPAYLADNRNSVRAIQLDACRRQQSFFIVPFDQDSKNVPSYLSLFPADDPKLMREECVNEHCVRLMNSFPKSTV